MELFFTSYAALEDSPDPTGGDLHHLVDVLHEAAVEDGMPFILRDDGSYDLVINRFLRELKRQGVRSPNSWASYARDIFTWCRFLQERRGGKGWWQADGDDIAAYYLARRTTVHPWQHPEIGVSTWNRSNAALSKLYNWGLRNGHVSRSPFTYRWGRRRLEDMSIPVEINDANEPAARRGNMKFVSLDDYKFFRDVGLRGMLPDGREDPAFRGRNSARNAAFATLLVTTGLRLTEANSLLLQELPKLHAVSARPTPAPKSLPLKIAACIAKRQKARTVPLPITTLRPILEYTGIERVRAVDRGQERGKYVGRFTVRVTAIRRQAYSILLQGSTRRRSFDRMKPKARRAAVLCGPGGEPREPLVVWLTEQGVPMTSDTWETVFEDASKRCQRFGRDLYVTPHMLRHTFAVYKLAWLIEMKRGSRFSPRSPAMANGMAAYDRLTFDPLKVLMNELGHASITSTFIYLDTIEEAQALVDDAAGAMASQFDDLTGGMRVHA